MKYLSKFLDPSGEDAGICSYNLGENGVIAYAHNSGFEEELDTNVAIHIEDDNPLSIAIRTQKLQIVEMKTLYDEYKDSTHKELQSKFATGMAMSLNSRVVVGILLKTNYETIIRYGDYFECINELMKCWYSHQEKSFESKFSQINPLDAKLSERQNRIIELIKGNRTNASIASILGYSESLIRQETIQIYRKLGISGRRELLAGSLHIHQSSTA